MMDLGTSRVTYKEFVVMAKRRELRNVIQWQIQVNSTFFHL